MRTTRTAVTVTAAVAAALLTAAGTAAAGTATPLTPTSAPTSASTAAKAPAGDGARALCRRAPKTEARIERALKRLNGPVTVRGSVARLQKRVDNAAAKGDTAVETYLKDKLAFRTSLIPTLNQRSTDLAAVRAWCATRPSGGQTDAK